MKLTTYIKFADLHNEVSWAEIQKEKRKKAESQPFVSQLQPHISKFIMLLKYGK